MSIDDYMCVREVAIERGLTTITALAEQAGLDYDTTRDLWHGRMQRIDRDVLTVYAGRYNVRRVTY